MCTLFFEFDDEFLDEEDDFDVNGGFDPFIGTTVWYTLEGNCGPITASTEDFRFATPVVGVYASDGGVTSNR